MLAEKLGYLGKLSQTNVLILDEFGLRNYTHEEATFPAIAEAITDKLINPSFKINDAEKDRIANNATSRIFLAPEDLAI